MWHNYDTSFPQLGRNIHSKVYLLSKAFLNDKIVVKIYEKERQKYFKNEKKILDILNNKYENNENNNENKNNNFFPMYKEILYNFNLFKIPKEIKGGDLEFLFFDYLPNLSLLDYIIDIKKGIKEIHIKFLCYKLLLAIKNLREKNICHNAINISNILFDENYNPKIIHFSEASIIEKKTLLNNDLFNLGQTLAKIISLGKLESIVYNKKVKVFKIKEFNQEKVEEESKFWEKLKIIDDIIISEQFVGFFHLLIYRKILNNIIDIEEIMKNEWLNEVNNNLIIHQKNFEKDFQIMHLTVMENRKQENKIKIDFNINNIININNKEDDNLIYNFYNNYYYKKNSMECPYLKLSLSETNYIMNPFNRRNMSNDKKNPENTSNKMMKDDIFNNVNITKNNKMMINFILTDIKEKTFLIQREFNIFDILFKNYTTEKNIKDALLHFIQYFTDNVDNKFLDDDFINKEIITFNKDCFIPPLNYDDYNEIIFFDEKFEQIAKYGLKFLIKFIIIKKYIDEYILVLEGINIDKEYLYNFLKDFKGLVKKILKSKI